MEIVAWRCLSATAIFSCATLCLIVGTGAHIGVAFVCAMLGAMLGLFNPTNKKQMLTAIIVCYVLTSSVAGYISARLDKFCETKAWNQTTLLTATLVPGLLIAMFSILNMLLSTVHAATAVTFSTLLDLLLLWTCGVSPLVSVESVFGMRANKINIPITKANETTRVAPDLPWYLHPLMTMLVGGILPFGCVWVELNLFMSALWLRQVYFVKESLFAMVFALVLKSLWFCATCNFAPIIIAGGGSRFGTALLRAFTSFSTVSCTCRVDWI